VTGLDEVLPAVISVGRGRGFVIHHDGAALVITAGHCLPYFPPCSTFSYTSERTYQALLGPLGGERTIWSECLFADPIADIAVLGPPDGQALTDQAEAYEALMAARKPLP